ncbi:MAG TPA: outer membrane beta-barrel protein [Verrucomicrobiae bacterium]|nr:outer membrane beta-barrel protein [Verrucomicrobiae bacterium]
MKMNLWTAGLVAMGAVSVASVASADDSANSVLTSLSSSTLSGYVDTSAQWNLGTGDKNAPAYAFGGASKADGFNLNVVKLTLEHAPDANDGWGAGYKVDLLFGPDADALGTQSTGVAGDFGIKQAYVDLKVPVGNGLDFKVGVWDTIIGYESFESVNDPNFTRSYGYTIEPTTHTGVLGTYQFCEAASGSVGVANTFGPAINSRAFSPTGAPGFQAESYKTYMGSLAITAPTNWGWVGGSTLNAGIINGFNIKSPVTINQGTGHADQTSYYAGITLNTPLSALKFGAAYDYVIVGTEHEFGVKASRANAAGIYAAYQLCEKCSINARGEYFFQTKQNATAGLPSKVLEGTLTLQYDLWKNVLSRVEFRWDHQADGTGLAYGAPSAEPILHGSLRNSYELIANIAYKF